jgi:hypothetical protein
MLSEIHLPDTIRYLGNTAFYRCPSLTAISLPEGLTEIDRWCFAECSSLASMSFFHLKRLGGGAFRDCVLWEKAYLPDAMDYVGEGVFAGCFGIRELVYRFLMTKVFIREPYRPTPRTIPAIMSAMWRSDSISRNGCHPMACF